MWLGVSGLEPLRLVCCRTCSNPRDRSGIQVRLPSSEPHLTTEKSAMTSTCLLRCGTTPAVLESSRKGAPRRAGDEAGQTPSRAEVRSARKADRAAMQRLVRHIDAAARDAQAAVASRPPPRAPGASARATRLHRFAMHAPLRKDRSTSPPRVATTGARSLARCRRRSCEPPTAFGRPCVAHAAVVCRTACSQFAINSAARSRGIVGRKRRSTCHCAASSSRFL